MRKTMHCVPWVLLVITVVLFSGLKSMTGIVHGMNSAVTVADSTDVLNRADTTIGYPRLLFSINDVHSFREKVNEGWISDAFKLMCQEADSLMSVRTNPYVFYEGVPAGRALQVQVLTLAMTGYLTGNEKYIDKAIDILCAAARQSDVYDMYMHNTDLSVGDAAHAYVIGYDWLAPFMTPEQRKLMESTIESYGEFLFEYSFIKFWGEDNPHRQAHNWNAVTHGALGLCALVLDSHAEWLDRAIERIRGYLEYSADSTGACYEGITYMAYGLQNSIPFIEALSRLTGLDLLKESPSTALKPRYLLWQLAPWGKEVVPINQSASSLRPSGGTLYLISRFRDEVGLWGWLRLLGPDGDRTYGRSSWMGDQVSLPYVVLWADPNLKPVSPEDAGLRLSMMFSRGQVSIRDGWDADDALVTFTSGEVRPLIWSHEDGGSFTFYAFGEKLVVDPGAGKTGTSDHNTILIDGIGQAVGKEMDYGRIVDVEDIGSAVYVKGDITQAYANRQSIVHAERQLLFGRVSQPYLLIVDDIQKDSKEHVYSWLLHSAPGNRIQIDEDLEQAMITGVNNRAVCLVQFFMEEEIQLQSDNTSDHPILKAETSSVNPRFVMLLVAVKQGDTLPVITSEDISGNLQVRLEFSSGVTDLITIGEDMLKFERRNADGSLVEAEF